MSYLTVFSPPDTETSTQKRVFFSQSQTKGGGWFWLFSSRKDAAHLIIPKWAVGCWAFMCASEPPLAVPGHWFSFPQSCKSPE